MKKKVSEFPEKVYIGLQDGYCNLKCPMCFVFGERNNEAIKKIRGQMAFENASRIFDEVKEAKPFVVPHLWSEPFMMKDLCKYIMAIKERDMSVGIHTNGLLLTDKIAKFLVDIGLDSINFSIDATTRKTLKKIRGIETLDKIEDAVFKMLNERGTSIIPRISTSFVIEKRNEHEEEEFISNWLKHVDMVRVNETYNTDGSVKNVKAPEERQSCDAIYNTIVINHTGEVSICCLDTFRRTKIGNVFKDGVQKVWHSEGFNRIRRFHEKAQYDKIPFCKNCTIWSKFLMEETIKDGILIRKSSVMTYYNRIDRLNSWIRKSEFKQDFKYAQFF